MKTRHVFEEHLYFDRLVGLLQGEPEEDRQVGRNIGVLQKRVSSSFVFSILFYEETINTYWMLVKDFIYIYIYIIIFIAFIIILL